jgi:hypothetical protein
MPQHESTYGLAVCFEIAHVFIFFPHFGRATYALHCRGWCWRNAAICRTRTRPTSATGATAANAMPHAASTGIPLRFESTLSRYKPMTDQKLGSWREANDTVTRIGGWRTYLKESQAPDTAAPATTAPSTTARPVAPSAPAAPNPHAGHGAKP